jgi:hypothetical protein
VATSHHTAVWRACQEDYDFTCRQLLEHGKVCRSNRVFVTATHYTNAGGAVAIRTAEREQYNIAILKHSWPGVFQRHPTRGDNEARRDRSERVVIQSCLQGRVWVCVCVCGGGGGWYHRRTKRFSAAIHSGVYL